MTGLLRNKLTQDIVFFKSHFYLFLRALVSIANSGEGLQFFLRVIADFLVDIEAEGEEIEEDLMCGFLGKLERNF
jgi:hypothetical protein